MQKFSLKNIYIEIYYVEILICFFNINFNINFVGKRWYLLFFFLSIFNESLMFLQQIFIFEILCLMFFFICVISLENVNIYYFLFFFGKIHVEK